MNTNPTDIKNNARVELERLMEEKGYEKFEVPGVQIPDHTRFKREIRPGLEVCHWIQGPPTNSGYYVVSVTKPWTLPHQRYVKPSELEEYIGMVEETAQKIDTR